MKTTVFRFRLFRFLLLIVVLLLGALLGVALLARPQIVAQGETLYRGVCAQCHEIDARGGPFGPDLTSGNFTHGDGWIDLYHTIARGVPGTAMPPQNVGLLETFAIVAYVRTLRTGADTRVPGDVTAGEAIFFGEGNCWLCHRVRDRGGRLGPELTRVGARRPPRYLAEKIRDPNKGIVEGFETISVVDADGRSFRGVRRNEDSFSVQLLDDGENYHSFWKKDLWEIRHERESLMPPYDAAQLNDKKIQDLVAFLVRLRGR